MVLVLGLLVSVLIISALLFVIRGWGGSFFTFIVSSELLYSGKENSRVSSCDGSVNINFEMSPLWTRACGGLRREGCIATVAWERS